MRDFKDLRIVFMGTPDFAVASLKALQEAGCNLVAVVTAPDKPAGRGMQLSQSAVKKYAVDHGLLVLQPEKLKAPEFIAQLQSLHADLFIVVAFRMLPEVVWNMPPMGTVNLHASLLPQYRGAAPINHAIINGEKRSGVTTFKLKHEIDTGNILLQAEVDVLDDDDAGILHDKLMTVGADLLVNTVQQLALGKITPREQSMSATIKHAPKIFPEDCEINWNSPANAVYNKIRGLSPYPGAYTFINGKRLKIFKAALHGGTPKHAAGSYETDNKTYLHFAAADGVISVLDLQLEGKKRMDIETFLRGNRLV